MYPAALRNRQYARLWGATSISSFGNQLTYLSLPMAAYASTGSATAFATVFMASNLGMLVTLLLGGAFADRFDRQRMMVASDACMLVVISALGLAVLTERWWLAAAVAFVQTLIASLLAAGGALQRDLVRDEHRTQANALTQFTMNANQLAAPLAGMALFLQWGFLPIVVVDVCTTVVSLVLLLGVRDPRSGSGPAETLRLRETVARAVADVRAGARVVWNDRWLRVQIPGNVVGSIGNGMFIVAIVPWLVEVMHLDESMFGPTIAVVGGAGVVASLFATRMAGATPANLIAVGAALGVVGTVVFIVPLPLPLMWACLVLFGISNVVLNIGFTTARQRRFDGTLQGRLGSLQIVNHQACNLVGMGLAGVLVGAIGAAPVMAAVGIAIAVNCCNDVLAARILVHDPIVASDLAVSDADLAISG